MTSLNHNIVYIRGNTIFLMYVDDGIFAGTSKEEIDQTIVELQ